MTNPIVSIVVPCYNQGKFLPETLDSVANQTYKNWECIIVNDGSPDDTEEIAQRYCAIDPRFRYVKKLNGGLSSARNAGLKAAKGKYIQLLDSDDLIENEKLEKQVKILNENSHIDLVYGKIRYFESENPNHHFLSFDLSNNEWMPRVSGTSETILGKLRFGNIMTCNCPLFRINCLSIIGYFNENLFNHEDYDFWIRMALFGFYFYFDDSTSSNALVRVHPTSMTRNSNMHIGFALVQLKLFIDIKKYNYNVSIAENLIRNEKKKLIKLYLNSEIGAVHLRMIFTPSENLRLSIISIIPEKLRYYFLAFNLADLRKKLNFDDS